MTLLKIGLLINPVAGVGGAVALKGSDSDEVQRQAEALGGQPRGAQRTNRTLAACTRAKDVAWFTWGGNMGEAALSSRGLACHVLGQPAAVSDASDTRDAATALLNSGVDLLVFSGGDGTARDILEAVGEQIPVLGIPCGVKMHSGVFATTPERAGALIDRLLEGGLVNAVTREVRDLDEAAIGRGEIRPRFFGELKVPEPGGYLQHTKERGMESEALAVTEIVAEVVERLSDESRVVLLGPGSTLLEIKRALGFAGTLLGFDVWHNGAVLGLDVNASWLEETLKGAEAARVVLSFTRGQGFLIGRGNQQLSPTFLRRLGREALWVVGTRTKLKSLDGRPLLMDTDDPELDQNWAGLVEVITGYEDCLYYRLSDHE